MSIQRRTIIRGAAWAAPAVVAASAAPAFAVTTVPQPRLFTHGRVNRSSTQDGVHVQWVSIDLAAYTNTPVPAAPDPNLDGVSIVNSVAGTAITQTQIVIYLHRSGITFTLDTGSQGGSGWSLGGTVAGTGARAGYTGYIFNYTKSGGQVATASPTNYGATRGVDNLRATVQFANPNWLYTEGGPDDTFFVDASVNYGGATLTHSSTGTINFVNSDNP